MTHPASPIIACLNGSMQVVVHYDYVRDCDTGNILGVTPRVTNAHGVPVSYNPAIDELRPGPCGETKDWEYGYYDDSAATPGAVCRKIVLKISNDFPPTFDGFEITGQPIIGFDATYLKENCGCVNRTPAIVW